MPTKEHQTIVVVTGLGIGEETKGSTVEWIAQQVSADRVLRSGGSQSGHFIVRSDGREQMFSHFGAATFDGVPTHLIHMVINPVNLFSEAVELEAQGVKDPFSLITIDENCLSVTPFHGAISRFREIMRGDDKKGTIGKGVGDAIRDSHDPALSIRAGEFKNPREAIREKIAAIRLHKLKQATDIIDQSGIETLSEEALHELAILRDETLVDTITDSFIYTSDLFKIVDSSFLDNALDQDNALVCEASHGALLHPWYGFVPHVTQIDPTSGDVMETLRQHERIGKILRIGVSRCYITRHGAGPLVSYSGDMSTSIQETHNNDERGNKWLGEFRNGAYDIVAMKYAVAISGGITSFDGLSISYMDVLSQQDEWPICEGYIYTGDATDLDTFFVIQDGKIVDIKIHPNTRDADHYAHQVRLTQLLKVCVPVITYLKPEEGKSLEEVFVTYVESVLHIPVVATARGPRAEDRSLQKGHENFFNGGRLNPVEKPY